MPSDSPAHSEALVSVICRSIGREQLNQALQSIASQTHSNIEVILVDSLAKGLTGFQAEFPQLNLNVVTPDGQLQRSTSANAGLEAASGEWILFLDDDDWIAEDHIASLLHAAKSEPDCKAVYSNVQKTDLAGNPVDYRFEQSFDPVLLMRDNYIPIHAMLFHRSMVEAGCRFDSQFDIYEDWDFWLQLAEHTDFLHLDKLSAYYRQGGESDTDINDASLRYQNDNEIGQARAKLFSKWAHKWTGEQVNALLGSMDQSELVTQVASELESEHATNLAQQEQIRQLLADLESMHSQLASANSKINLSDQRIAELESRIAELETQTEVLLNSTSWKITAPLRYLSGLLRGNTGATDSSEDKS